MRPFVGVPESSIIFAIFTTHLSVWILLYCTNDNRTVEQASGTVEHAIPVFSGDHPHGAFLDFRL